MKGNIGELICIVVLLIPVLKGLVRAVRKRAVNYALNEVTGSISLIGAIIFMFNYFHTINLFIGEVVNKIEINSIIQFLIKIGLLGLTFSIVNFILYHIFKLINSLIFGNALRKIEESPVVRVLLSCILGFIKGILSLLILFIIVIFINKAGVFNKNIPIFNDISLYQKIESNISGTKINEIKSGLLENSDMQAIVYYNGVTLEQGVKSDKEINEKAKEITEDDKTDLEKAKSIYNWVGSHITYDNQKAKKVMSGNVSLKSGAIEAFNTREGICFDYACLYVAMAREVGLKVRLITGEAYNGQEYISHAWNQVYIKSLDKWINVDPTFYRAGDYFNNLNFNKDHKEESIAGQWD